jgi:dTDP-4-dehydrorhamnose reductase
MYDVLITGCNGQLGSSIKELANNYNFEFEYTDKEELDIIDIEALDRFFRNNKKDFIINCAAYTSVDNAESDYENAMRLNCLAAANLALMSNKYNSKLIHISTDFVFDGAKNTPYTEEDKANPLSVYGESKLAGEETVFQNSNSAIIIRTSWLYSNYGHNFVKTILKYAREKGSLKVVYDQIGAPTYAKDLAKAVLDMLLKIEFNKKILYHYSNEGVASWYDFAKAIVELSNIDCKVEAIETKDYPTPAKRPHYSVMNKSKIKDEFSLDIPYWRDSLKECLNQK